MKMFASQPVMLEDADLDYVTGGFNVANTNSANSLNNSFNNSDFAENTNSANSLNNSFNDRA